MFKSIFAKYITVFMLIILISFVALIAIITSTVNGYSVNSRTDQMESAAHSVSAYLEDKLERSELTDFSAFVVLNESDITSVLRVVTANAADISILITDISGNIINYTDSEVSHINTGASIPKAVMDELINGVEISELNYLEGVFEDSHMIFAVPVINSNNYVHKNPPYSA